MFNPSLYRFEDVTGNDIGFSGGLMMAYRYRPTLSWSLGVFVSPNSSLSPVLPVADWIGRSIGTSNCSSCFPNRG